MRPEYRYSVAGLLSARPRSGSPNPVSWSRELRTSIEGEGLRRLDRVLGSLTSATAPLFPSRRRGSGACDSSRVPVPSRPSTASAYGCWCSRDAAARSVPRAHRARCTCPASTRPAGYPALACPSHRVLLHPRAVTPGRDRIGLGDSGTP